MMNKKSSSQKPKKPNYIARGKGKNLERKPNQSYISQA